MLFRSKSFRRILNFGHTIGHALELLSNYTLSHGRSIAIGMCAEAEMSVSLGLLPRTSSERLRNLVASYGLPTAIPIKIDRSDIIRATLSDKKANNGSIRYTLLNHIGKGRVDVRLRPDEVRRMILR